MMDNQRLHFLLEKLENKTVSLAEQQEINEFYQSFDKQPDFTDSVANLEAYEQFYAIRMSSAIDEHRHMHKRSNIKLKYWIGLVAAVLLIALGLFLVLNNNFNSIITAKGETKQVELPDGSLVTLNAASTLTYSVNFTKEQARVVELSGEAYFEVKKDKQHPFIVKTTDQKIEVLGTRFNVNAYQEETSTITTLFEGSIKISLLSPSITNTTSNAGQIIIPGQTVILKNGRFTISPSIEENAIAWKNGVFCFDSESLESAMNKISRWYDVDIAYLDDRDKVKNYDRFLSGRVSKSVDLQRLLKVIEKAAPVQFTVKKDKVIVKLKN